MERFDTTAGIPASRPLRRQTGFSMIELIITATIVIILVYMVTTLSISGTDAQKFAERANRATEISQNLLDDVRAELTSSVRLFHDDAVGNGYLGIIDWTGASPPITSTLPRLDSTGIFERDSGTPKTGNLLMFAKHAWSDEYVTPTNSARYRVDVYRILVYYLAEEDSGPEPGSPIGLNLCRYVSEPMVDGGQIDKISDATDQAEFLEHLRTGTADANGRTHTPLNLIWVLGGDPATAGTFRQILSLGVISATPAPPRAVTWQITCDTTASSRGLLTYRHHSIASNYAPAVMGVGRFGIIDNSGDGFPHGFELQMIGPSSARQVLLRTSIVSTNNKGLRAHALMQMITDARDV